MLTTLIRNAEKAMEGDSNDAEHEALFALVEHLKAEGKQPFKTYFTKADECIRLCEAMAAFWGDDVCDAAIHPGAYLTEEDTPFRDLVRAAVGWRKPSTRRRGPLVHQPGRATETGRLPRRPRHR